MEVVIVLAFIGLALASGMVLLFASSLKARDYQHADRLALLPVLRDDAAPAPAPSIQSEVRAARKATPEDARNE